MADMNSQDSMPTGAMAAAVTPADTQDTENLGDVWRATANKAVTESKGEKMPGETDMESTEHSQTMPGE